MQVAAHCVVVFLCLLANIVPGAHAVRVRRNVRDILRRKREQEVDHLGQLTCHMAHATWVCLHTGVVTRESEAYNNPCVRVWCESTDRTENKLFAKIEEYGGEGAPAARTFVRVHRACCAHWDQVQRLQELAAPAQEEKVEHQREVEPPPETVGPPLKREDVPVAHAVPAVPAVPPFIVDEVQNFTGDGQSATRDLRRNLTAGYGYDVLEELESEARKTALNKWLDSFEGQTYMRMHFDEWLDSARGNAFIEQHTRDTEYSFAPDGTVKIRVHRLGFTEERCVRQTMAGGHGLYAYEPVVCPR